MFGPQYSRINVLMVSISCCVPIVCMYLNHCCALVALAGGKELIQPVIVSTSAAFAGFAHGNTAGDDAEDWPGDDAEEAPGPKKKYQKATPAAAMPPRMTAFFVLFFM